MELAGDSLLFGKGRDLCRAQGDARGTEMTNARMLLPSWPRYLTVGLEGHIVCHVRIPHTDCYTLHRKPLLEEHSLGKDFRMSSTWMQPGIRCLCARLQEFSSVGPGSRVVIGTLSVIIPRKVHMTSRLAALHASPMTILVTKSVLLAAST